MRILLVDDDASSREAVSISLKLLGHELTVCKDGEEALRRFEQTDFPMLLTDIRMPGMSGIELLRAVKERPDGWRTDIVLFTGQADVDSAVAALRGGAYDYLLKPVDARQLDLVAGRISEHQSLLRENRDYKDNFTQIVSEATEETRRELETAKKRIRESAVGKVGTFSPSMTAVMELAFKFHSDRAIPVLIQGETGVGKEIVARGIHFGAGIQNDGPFIDINCAAIAPTLFESELFGYEAGAFTGAAVKGQKGKIEAAQGGTLFLDEVGEIPLELQGKFLRVLQEKEYYRVGGVKQIKADVRIVCATNVPLEERVEAGVFRKDLYYRLKVGNIIIPPLRERPDEIVPLAEMFLADFSRQKGKRFCTISPDASRQLKEHAWPGNVRELKNCIEFIVFMFDAVELDQEHLKEALSAKNMATVHESKIVDTAPEGRIVLPMPSGGYSMKSYNDDILAAVLSRFNGNQTAAAKYLGLSLRALVYRLEQLKDRKGNTQS